LSAFAVRYRILIEAYAGALNQLDASASDAAAFIREINLPSASISPANLRD
jgi:hypothetical protein